MVLRLTAMQRFSLRARKLLMGVREEDVGLWEFECAYADLWAEPIRPERFGYPTLIGLIRAASHVLYIKGRGASSTVCINRNFLGTRLSCSTAFVGEFSKFL